MHYTASLREQLFFWLCIKRGFNIFANLQKKKKNYNDFLGEKWHMPPMYAGNGICPDKALISVCLCVCVYRARIHCPILFRAQTIWQALLRSTWRKIYICRHCMLVCSCHHCTLICLLLILLLSGQWGMSSGKLWIKHHYNTPGTVNSNSEYEVFVCDVIIFPC